VEPEGVLFDLRAHRGGALRAGLAARGVAADRLGPDVLARAAALPPEQAVRAAVAAAAAAGDAAAAACDDVDLALAAHATDRAFADLLARGGLTLRDGAREAVAALGARLRLAVVTRLRRAEVAGLLGAAELGPAFAVVIAADDRLPPPPAGPPGVRTPGACWAAALGRLGRQLSGLRAAQAVAVVDTPAAAADARAAGLRTAVVADEPARDGVPGETPGGAGGGRAEAAADPDPRGPDVRLVTLRGITPATLACALDLAPGPCPPRP
jgi:beta-phosphoglucomutase-like phosphatase (HAD superfamily)